VTRQERKREEFRERAAALREKQGKPMTDETPPPPAPEDDAPAMQMVEHEQPEVEPEVFDDEPREPETPYEMYLASLPDEARELLDEKDLRAAFDAAEREAKEERRRQLTVKAKDRAKRAARKAAGLLTQEEIEAEVLAERMDKMVKITIQMPFVGDTGGIASDAITLDGVRYFHGQTYTVPYGRALSIRSILYTLHQHELDFEGRGRLNGLRRQQASGVNIVDFRKIA
jgi:hypothetical protein